MNHYQTTPNYSTWCIYAFQPLSDQIMIDNNPNIMIMPYTLSLISNILALINAYNWSKWLIFLKAIMRSKYDWLYYDVKAITKYIILPNWCTFNNNISANHVQLVRFIFFLFLSISVWSCLKYPSIFLFTRLFALFTSKKNILDFFLTLLLLFLYFLCVFRLLFVIVFHCMFSVHSFSIGGATL